MRGVAAQLDEYERTKLFEKCEDETIQVMSGVALGKSEESELELFEQFTLGEYEDRFEETEEQQFEALQKSQRRKDRRIFKLKQIVEVVRAEKLKFSTKDDRLRLVVRLRAKLRPVVNSFQDRYLKLIAAPLY